MQRFPHALLIILTTLSCAPPPGPVPLDDCESEPKDDKRDKEEKDGGFDVIVPRPPDAAPSQDFDLCACTGPGKPFPECPAEEPQGCGPPPSPPSSSSLTPKKAFDDVYAKVEPTCSGCHRTGNQGAPIYFGADVKATYPLFKARNFHTADSRLATKGAHAGPALARAQASAISLWIATEAGIDLCKCTDHRVPFRECPMDKPPGCP